MMITKHDVLIKLQSHIGKNEGITAKALAGQLDAPMRQVRHLITDLRMEGHAVCGHPRDGYYIARTAEELEETLKFLRSRALHSLSIEAAMRKLSLLDLLGQMRLKS